MQYTNWTSHEEDATYLGPYRSNDLYVATDSRDGKRYLVARFGDNYIDYESREVDRCGGYRDGHPLNEALKRYKGR